MDELAFLDNGMHGHNIMPFCEEAYFWFLTRLTSVLVCMATRKQGLALSPTFRILDGYIISCRKLIHLSELAIVAISKQVLRHFHQGSSQVQII